MSGKENVRLSIKETKNIFYGDVIVEGGDRGAWWEGGGGSFVLFFYKKKYYESLINENSKRVINYSMLPIL